MRHRVFHLCTFVSIVIVTLPGCSGTRHITARQTGVLAPPTVTDTRDSDSHAFPQVGGPVQVAALVGESDDRTIKLTSASDASEGYAEEPVPLTPVPIAEGNEGIGVWTLEALEATALQNNPAIAQASASAHKAMGFRDQVGIRPNPTVGYNATQLADRGTDQHVAFVEQDFVTAGKLTRNRNVLNQEIQSQLWEVETQRIRVQTDVRQRFYSALAAQRRLALATEFRDIAQKGVEIAQARVNAKEGSVPEVLQAEIQLTQVEVQRRQAEAAFRGAWKQLMAVTGLGEMPTGTLSGMLPDSPTVGDVEPLRMQALSSSPELQAARSRVARARANVERQEVQAIPNMSFQLAAGVDNGTDSGMINAQVGLPVPVFNRNQGNIAAAHAELSRACQELKRIELSIASRMAGATQEYESATAAVEQYRDMILPKAKQTLSLSEEAYGAGEFGFLQVLVARRTYFESNLEYVVAQSNLAQAEAYLRGLALSGGLSDTRDTEFDAGLRDQSLSGQ